MTGDENKLTGGQWCRRGVYDKSRLPELRALYEDLGFEVRIRPVTTGTAKDCTRCLQASPGSVGVLYTKKIDACAE